jgi:hypothetical protein
MRCSLSWAREGTSRGIHPPPPAVPWAARLASEVFAVGQGGDFGWREDRVPGAGRDAPVGRRVSRD